MVNKNYISFLSGQLCFSKFGNFPFYDNLVGGVDMFLPTYGFLSILSILHFYIKRYVCEEFF